MRVEIDGVVYVPASEAFANAAAIEEALIRMWWGTGAIGEGDRMRWRRSLKVVISDTFDSGEGDTLQDVVATIANASSTHSE